MLKEGRVFDRSQILVGNKIKNVIEKWNSWQSHYKINFIKKNVVIIKWLDGFIYKLKLVLKSWQGQFGCPEKDVTIKPLSSTQLLIGGLDYNSSYETCAC